VDDDRVIQDWTHAYDEAGNLRRRLRADSVNAGPAEEAFGYDALNRLTSSEVDIPSLNYNNVTESYAYDNFGNFTQKAGKNYTYGNCMAGGRAAGPHAVCSVGGSALFAYDANGNL